MIDRIRRLNAIQMLLNGAAFGLLLGLLASDGRAKLVLLWLTLSVCAASLAVGLWSRTLNRRWRADLERGCIERRSTPADTAANQPGPTLPPMPPSNAEDHRNG